MAAALFQVCRSQIHRNSADRKAEPTAFCSSTDPFPGLLHRRIRQAHNVKTRQTAGNITFRCDQTAPDTGDTQCLHAADQLLHPLAEMFIGYYIIPPFSQKLNLFLHYSTGKHPFVHYARFLPFSCVKVLIFQKGGFYRLYKPTGKCYDIQDKN